MKKRGRACFHGVRLCTDLRQHLPCKGLDHDAGHRNTPCFDDGAGIVNINALIHPCSHYHIQPHSLGVGCFFFFGQLQQ